MAVRWPAMIRQVSGLSMQPTLEPGQIVIVSGLLSFRPGSVIMFSHRGIEKIKRIAAIDELGITVVGDNPSASTDSRTFGPINPESVLGVVVWPRIN